MGKDDPPDLTLSGEMLESITILNDKSGEIVIGFEKGDEVNGKAEGNILGSYGGTPKKSRVRNFLDMAQSEINQILKNYPLRDRDARSDRVEGIKATGEVIREYLGYETDNEDE